MLQHRYLKILISVLGYIHEVALLDHRVVLCIRLEGIYVLFFIYLHLCTMYITTKGVPFLPCQYLLSFFFFFFWILVILTVIVWFQFAFPWFWTPLHTHDVVLFVCFLFLLPELLESYPRNSCQGLCSKMPFPLCFLLGVLQFQNSFTILVFLPSPQWASVWLWRIPWYWSSSFTWPLNFWLLNASIFLLDSEISDIANHSPINKNYV